MDFLFSRNWFWRRCLFFIPTGLGHSSVAFPTVLFLRLSPLLTVFFLLLIFLLFS